MRRLHNPTDVESSADSFGTSCGHAALAALIGHDVRPLFLTFKDIFDNRPHVNTFMVERILSMAGLRWQVVASRNIFPIRGMVQLQWEGPWMAEGLPIGARLSRTHWIACDLDSSSGEMMVYDINSPEGWCGQNEWKENVLPALLSVHPNTSGWSVRASYRVAPVKHAPVPASA